MDDEALTRILSTYRVVAVVGLSADWHRPSYFAAKYLQAHGYRVIPINPRYRQILGEACYPGLEALPPEVARTIEVVDVFRRSDDVMPIAEQTVALGAKVLWQQLGVVNAEADAHARANGLESVMDRCMKIEHARLFGGLGWAGVNTGVISARRPRQIGRAA
jgi:predicted CoA-binding protein